MSTVTVFKAKDGKWQYAPSTLRNWPMLANEGRFPSKDAATEAAEQEHPQDVIKIEAGFLARFL